MTFVRNLVSAILAPQLYGKACAKIRGRTYYNAYLPNRLEKWPDMVFTAMAAPLTVYLVPLFGMYWTLQNPQGLITTIWFCMNWGKTFLAAIFGLFLIRAVGRVINPTYLEFLHNLHADRPRREYLEGLRHFDFEFKAFPVCYTVGPKLGERYEIFRKNPFRSTVNAHMPFFKRIPLQILAFFVAHTLALALIYPGSMTAVRYVFRDQLSTGRCELVEKFSAERAKLLTQDGNHIDTMFVDNRLSNPNGNTLVINCEGNAGFYENGIMTCSLKAGYSSLGYNRPGFGGSTGNPYPCQDAYAVDAVLQYAINECGFDQEDIVMFGWSIGGYSAATAAAKYPDIRCMVLDASFDHVLPLALRVMPTSWSPLVKEVILTYFDLDVSGQVAKYHGPIQLVRRLQDEIVALEPKNVATNCGNELVLNIIIQRHLSTRTPSTLQVLRDYIGHGDRQRGAILQNTINPEHKNAMLLTFKYLIDVNTNHCDLMSASLLQSTVSKLSTLPTDRD